MPTLWEDVVNNDQYKNYSSRDKELAKVQYFSEVVGPNLAKDDIPEARNQFFQYASSLEQKQPSFWKDVVVKTGKDIAESAKPLLELGSWYQAPYNIAKKGLQGESMLGAAAEEIAKPVSNVLKIIQPAANIAYTPAVMTQEGIKNIVRKARDREPVSPTGLGDVVKFWKGEERTGIVEEVRGKKFESPFVQGMVEGAETFIDPLLGFAGVAQSIVRNIPKGFIGKIPKAMLEDLKYLREDEAVQKLANLEIAGKIEAVSGKEFVLVPSKQKTILRKGESPYPPMVVEQPSEEPLYQAVKPIESVKTTIKGQPQLGATEVSKPPTPLPDELATLGEAKSRGSLITKTPAELRKVWDEGGWKGKLEVLDNEVATNRTAIIEQSRLNAEARGLPNWTPEKAIDEHYKKAFSTTANYPLKKGETWRGRTEKLAGGEQPKLGAPEVKQPWEMTREENALVNLGSKSRPGEFVYPEDAKDSAVRKFEDLIHKRSVEQALSEGKPVPPKVLKDYPDLAKGATKPLEPLAGEAKLDINVISKEQRHKDFLNKVINQTQAEFLAENIPSGGYGSKFGVIKNITKKEAIQEYKNAIKEAKAKPTGEVGSAEEYFTQKAVSAKSKQDFLEGQYEIPIDNLTPSISREQIIQSRGMIKSKTPDEPVILGIREGKVTILNGNNRYYEKLDKGEKTIKAEIAMDEGMENFYDQAQPKPTGEGKIGGVKLYSGGIDTDKILALADKVGKKVDDYLRDIGVSSESISVFMSNLGRTAREVGEEAIKREKPSGLKPLGTIEAKIIEREPLPKYAGSINLTKLDVADDVKQIMAEGAKKGRKISWQETKEKAQALGWDDISVIKAGKKKAWSSSEIEAGRQVNVDAANQLEVFIKSLPLEAERTPTMKAQLAGMLLEYRAVRDVVSKKSGEAGRALNIYKKIIAPEKRVNFLIDTLTKDGKDISGELIDRLQKLDWTNISAINNFIKSLEKPKFMDYIYEWWYNSILSGPPTHLVNTISNTTWQATQPLFRGVRAAVDIPVSLAKGTQREYYFREIPAMFAGYKTGVKRGTAKFLEMLKKGHVENDITKWDIEMGRSIGAFERSPSKILRKGAPFVSAPTRALRAEDVLFRGIAWDADISASAIKKAIKGGLKGEERSQKIAELIANPTDDMIESAGNFADYSTFMDAPGKIGETIMKLRDSVPGGRFIVPFVRTIGNLMKRGIEMTPGIGITIQKGQPAADIISKQIIGSGISLYFATKYLDGELTGAVPSDKAERESFYRQKKQPWAVRFGDNWYSYRRIEPFNTIIGTIASIGDAWSQNKEDPTEEKLLKVATNMGRNLLDASYLSGLSDLISAVERGDRGADAIKKIAQRFPSGFMPYSSLGRSVVGAIETTDEGATVKQPRGAVQVFESQIPILSEKVPPKLNLWGQTIIKEGGIIRQWLPYKWSTESDDPVEKEIGRLGNLGYSYPGMPQKKIKGIELTEDQYDEYVEKAGIPAKKKLDNFIRTETYQNISDEIKHRAIDSIIKGHRRIAGVKMFIKIKNK